MSVTISIPRRLYEEAKRRGLDIETRVVEFLARELGLDPREEASLHLELAERFLHEAFLSLRKTIRCRRAKSSTKQPRKPSRQWQRP